MIIFSLKKNKFVLVNVAAFYQNQPESKILYTNKKASAKYAYKLIQQKTPYLDKISD